MSFFWPDAEFANVLGWHERRREASEALRPQILSTVYRGSRNAYTVPGMRTLTDDLVVVFADAQLRYFAEGVASVIEARPTLLSQRHDRIWQIAVFRNTAVAPRAAASRAERPGPQPT